MSDSESQLNGTSGNGEASHHDCGCGGSHSSRRLPEKPSKVEKDKAASDYLRGTVDTTLNDPTATRMADSDLSTLKFHGIYQQYDRDERAAGKQGKAERHYTLMVRARIPAGILTATQYLDLDALAQKYGHGAMRLTTRQSIQFHGIAKGDLRSHINGMNKSLISTLAACGDVMRNVMCCPAILDDPARAAVQKTAEEVALKLAPKTRAYHEIWIDGEKLKSDDPLLRKAASEPAQNKDEFEVEPLYGKLYLPRKFKLGIAMPDDNCIDVYTQDCGFIAIVDPVTRQLTGYNVLVGGGLGMTHAKADTFARLGSLIGSITPEQAVDTVRAVIEIFRDFGEREDRRHARLKYVVEEFGVDWFISEFNRRASFTLQPAASLAPIQHQDHLGWVEQGDGTFSYGLFIENGRVRDTDDHRIRTGIRTVVEELQPGVRLTPHQNILFTHVHQSQRDRLIEILREHRVPLNEEISKVRRNSMACPAMPTCGLALSDAERTLPDVMTIIESLLEELGIDQADISVRMTGCPNGCARPYTADIAFVGRSPGVFDIYAGGRLAGDRVVDFFADKVKQEHFIDVLRPVLETYSRERLPDEGFGDYWQRKSGRTKPKTLLNGAKTPFNPTINGQPLPPSPHAALAASHHEKELEA